MRSAVPFAVVASAVAIAAGPAAAHPHIFVEAKAELVFSGGAITAIRHTWQFDKAFSAFAVQGLDTNYDGKLSAAELAPLAEINVKGLTDYGYYTYLIVDQKNVDLAPPTDYRVEWNAGQVTLYFTLPLKAPAQVASSAALQVFDLEYYTAITFSEKDPFTLTNAPANCGGAYVKPQPLDDATLNALYAIPANQHIVPPQLRQAVSKLANIITVTCR